MKFKSDIEVQAGLKDSSGSNGSSGQVLSSNGGTVSWVNAGGGTASDVQNQVKAGVAINKGQAVYVTSADGTNIIVGLASNTTEATSSKTLGLLNATVAINGFADVVQIGKLEGLDTSTATVGDPVWLGTNGNLIYGLANKPYAPAHLVYIGVVTRVNANNGEIFVTVQNGFELKEIHDVDIITTPPSGGDVLGFEGAPVNLWVNKTIPGWLGYTPVPTTRTLTINGSTQDLSANRTFSIDVGVTSFNTRTGAVTLTSGDVITALGYTPVTQARTLTINGVAYDLSADRSWTVSGGIGGSGTTNYIPKFTASTTVGNSSLYDNGNIGFGTTSPNGLWSGSNKTLQITGGTNIASELVQSRPSATISRFLSGTSSTFGVYTADALNYEIYTSGSQRFAVNSSGNVIANVDSRAPIFYDSNDTTYYGDFASTSNFSKLLLNSQNSFNTTTPGLTSYGLTLMGGTADYANGVTWTWGNTNAQAGVYVQSSGAYGTKMYFATTDSFATGSKTGMSMDHNGTVLVNRSYLQSDSSLRAPIFYDSNNTGYYVDPASTSNLAGLTVANTITGSVSGSSGYSRYLPNNYVGGQQTNPQVYFNYAQGLNVAMTGAWSVWSDTLWINGYSGGDVPNMCALHFLRNGQPRMAISTQNREATSYGSFYEVITEWSNDQVKSGYFQSNSSLRAPVFYDSNNTGYYLDPSSTSNLYAANFGGPSHFTSNLGGYCGSLSNPPLQAYSDSNNSAFFSFHKGGNYALNMGLDADNVLRIGGWSASASRWELDMSGNNWVAGSFRAPIFYDSSDTGYYVDPASTSNLKFLQVGRPSNGQSGTKLLGGQGTSYGAITLDVEISNYGTGIKINNQGSTYANSAMAFFYNSSQCGGVSIGSNVTYYNTSSDYRLKENITSIDSAVNRLNKLKPCRFNFISNPEKTVDGFIAHEVQEVIPEAVTGFKDEFEEDGTPKYQGIDQSKIVPLLTAALQEAIEKINSLEQRINILENK